MNHFGIGSMCRTRPMTHLTTHTQLVRNDRTILFANPKCTRGMAGKTLQDPSRWIEDAISHTFRIPMAWRNGKRIRRPIPTLSMLQVIRFVQSANERDGLASRPEGPITRLTRRGRRQRKRMFALGLRGKLGQMTLRASLRSGKLSRARTPRYNRNQPYFHVNDCLPRRHERPHLRS